MYHFDNSLKQEMDTRYKECMPLWQQWWTEADLDTKMATGQQDFWGSFYGSNAGNRNARILMFNKVLRVINMIGGYQRKNRLATMISAQDEMSEQDAQDFSDLVHWAMQHDETYNKISETFEASSICGLNLMSIWMDFREDPENGDIVTSRIPYNAFLMDNYWTKKDLSDCDWIWTRRYLTRSQVISLHPKIKDDLPSMQKGMGMKDGRFQYLPQNWYQYNQELYAYDEYWTRHYRKVRKVLDTKTGEVIDWKGTREQFDWLKRINPNVKLISAMKPSVKLRVLVNNYLVYEEDQPFGIDRFPFVPFVGYHFPEVQNYGYRYQGVVRNLRDSQHELNHRRNKMLDILDAQVQSGIMVKEDALVNPEDAFLQGAGRVQFMKQTSNLATDVMHIPPPQIPPSMFELSSLLDKEIMEIAGVNEELFGQSANGKDMSGLLSSMRMGAALVSLQGLFDGLNQSQKHVGEIFMDMIQANFEIGKIEKILGRDVGQNFRDKDFPKYHCVVEEGELTSTQRQLQFQQAFMLKQAGAPISWSYLMEKLTIQGKKELMQSVEQEEKAASQAQAEQMKIMQRSVEAKAQNDFASAEERKTRAVSNIGLAKERSSQSAEDRALAALNNVRAVKELEELDENRLMKLAKFILELQQAQKALAGNEEGDSVEGAEKVESEISQSEKSTNPVQQQAQQPQQQMQEAM